MHAITKYRIYTGECFDSEEEAKKALIEIYGNTLLKLSKQLANLGGNYFEISKELDENFREYYSMFDEMETALANMQLQDVEYED